MTTNSPDPVYGDVQALIADCQAEIAEIEKALTTWGDAWIPYLQSKLKRQQVALAALTAEPVAHRYAYLPGIGDTDWKYVDSYEYANKSSGYSGQDLYATPPAQLLRTVELPGGFSPAIGDIFDRQAPVMRRDREDGCWIHKAVVAELLRSLGHEVKND